MKTMEFTYDHKVYRYELGRIINTATDFCPVLHKLNVEIENFTDEQLEIILGAILHAYNWGKRVGEEKKLREVRRVLGID